MAHPGPCAEHGYYSRVFDATPEAIRAILCSAARYLRLLLPEDVAGSVEIVLAEILNNIGEHGYSAGCVGRIRLSLMLDKSDLFCTVSDRGDEIPAGLFQTGPPRCSRPVPADLPEGGFGTFLIRDLTREIHYRREDGCNLITFHMTV